MLRDLYVAACNAALLEPQGSRQSYPIISELEALDKRVFGDNIKVLGQLQDVQLEDDKDVQELPYYYDRLRVALDEPDHESPPSEAARQLGLPGAA